MCRSLVRHLGATDFGPVAPVTALVKWCWVSVEDFRVLGSYGARNVKTH